MLKEYHSFLFHNLTNQQKITTKLPRLCYCIQIRILPVSVRIKLSLLLAFCWFKQAVVRFRFPRGFPRVALGTFVSFRTWVSTRCSGKTLLRDVTGEPCWNRGGYLMLVLRRYGVYTVFDSRVRYLSQPVLHLHLHLCI